MTELTISLSEEITARLREVAQRRGETLEQTAKALIESTLPPESPRLSPDDPDGTKMALGLIGALSGLGIKPFSSNEEIDRILAEEAVNPHDDE